MARVSKLWRHVAICDRGNILNTFLMKMEEFSLMTKTLFCHRIIKKMLSFLCVFYVYSSEKTISSVTTQHFNNYTKKKTYKRNKKTASSLPVHHGASKMSPSIINSCMLCVRVLCKTRRSFIRIVVSS